MFYNENFTFSLHNGKCVMLAMSLGAHCCVSLFDSKNWALSGRGSAISGLSASSRESRTHRKRLIALPTGRNSGGSTKHSILKNSLMCGTTTILRYAFSQNVRKLLQYFISPLGERARILSLSSRAHWRFSAMGLASKHLKSDSLELRNLKLSTRRTQTSTGSRINESSPS